MPLVILIAGGLLFAAAYPVESVVQERLEGLSLPGDIRREWEALQQFGQGVSVAIVSLVVFLLDPRRRGRLLDLGLALLAVGVVTLMMKLLIGRPRPRLGDHSSFLFPGGTYPVPVDGAGTGTVELHAWDLTAPSHAQLWSMPSSHTAFAVAMAIFLAVLYPKLRWLLAGLATVVAAGRLVFDAHWLTDVIAGATVSAAVTWPIVRSSAGTRLTTRVRRARPSPTPTPIEVSTAAPR
ncbi:MAG TPA: phosphatase PAP2 family protein [Phycisphaerales bacterium]|nr:phosphatase PAP2 family protein [Phycisphaerales bacterium]